MNDDLVKNFIDKINREKTPDETKKLVEDLVNFQSSELYLAMMAQLTEEDITAIEKISDDATAMEEIKKRFKDRSGMTPDEFAAKLREGLMKAYVSDEPAPTEDIPAD